MVSAEPLSCLAELQKWPKYELKTKKEIKSAIDSICKGVKEFLDVRILTERKQIKVKVSPFLKTFRFGRVIQRDYCL